MTRREVFAVKVVLLDVEPGPGYDDLEVRLQEVITDAVAEMIAPVSVEVNPPWLARAVGR